MASDEWNNKGQGLPNSYILHIQMPPAFFSRIFIQTRETQMTKMTAILGKMLSFLPQTLNSLKMSLPFLLIQVQGKRF